MEQRLKGRCSVYNYIDIGDFEIRHGHFNDPNEWANGSKWEIRILNKNAQVIEALVEKLKDVLNGNE